MNEDLVREIDRIVFTPVRLREGYDMGEVDRFLDALQAEVAAGRPIRHRVDGARFTPVRLREGYDMGAVDHFLAWLVATMEERLGDERVPTDDAGAAPQAAPPHMSPPPAAAAPTVAAQTSSVIEEHPGLWARVFRRNR